MKSEKRALVLVHSYYLRDTRAQRHANSLAERGWAIDVVCARDKSESFSERAGAIHIMRLPARRRGGSPLRKTFEYCSFALMAFCCVTFLWLVRRHRLVYVLGIPNFIVLCALVPRIAGARVLLDMRDPFPEFFLAKYDARERHPLLPVLLLEERLSARFASLVLTAVPSMATLYTRSLPRERIAVIWNAPDPKLFTRSSTVVKDPGDRTLLYVGTVTHPYGVDLAVRAVARLREKIPSLRMRIVGQGDLFASIDELARSEGISDRLIVDRSVPLGQIPDIVAQAWLGVQPNRDNPLMRYSLSTKIIEWCLLGLPVAAGRTPPLVEAFSEDEILFHDPGDLDGLCARICEADADPARLAGRAERARVAADRFRFDREIESFVLACDPP